MGSARTAKFNLLTRFIREKAMTTISDNFVVEIARVPKFCTMVDGD